MNSFERGAEVHPPVVTIGASAGGIQALQGLLPLLPADLPAALVIVIHRQPADQDARLLRVLSKGTSLVLRTIVDNDELIAGHIFICPAATHVKVEKTRLVLFAGPRENRQRPSIDVLFRSAAEQLGSGVIGVVLSGMLDDGTAGLAAIKAHGGVVIVQEPAEAEFSDMPRNAIENVRVDNVGTVMQLAAAIVAFANGGALRRSSDVAARRSHEVTEPTEFSCPECGGVLSHIEADGFVRFRCRTGHAYSPATLYSEQEETLEIALWASYRALIERVDMSERLARRASKSNLESAARRFEQQAAVARRRAELVKKALAGAATAIEAAGALGKRYQVDERPILKT